MKAQLCNQSMAFDLQKLLKYFSGTASFALYLNHGALSSLVTFTLSTISSLLKSHKIP